MCLDFSKQLPKYGYNWLHNSLYFNFQRQLKNKNIKLQFLVIAIIWFCPRKADFSWNVNRKSRHTFEQLSPMETKETATEQFLPAGNKSMGTNPQAAKWNKMKQWIHAATIWNNTNKAFKNPSFDHQMKNTVNKQCFWNTMSLMGSSWVLLTRSTPPPLPRWSVWSKEHAYQISVLYLQ